MTRHLVAILLVSLVGAPSSAATAAPTVRTLTVRGVPNAYAEVTFAGRVRFETATKSRPSYDAKGTYAGAYVEPVRGDGPVAGTVLLRAMPSLSDVPFPLGPQGWLPPGRYRVHLIGDGPTTVKIRAEGLRRDMTVTTTTRAEVAAKWVSRGVAGAATPADRTIVPFTVRPRTLTVVAEAHESTGFYGRRDVCVRTRTNGLSPCLDGNSGHGSYSGVYPFRWTLGGGAAYHPGALPPGEMEAEFLDVAVGVPHGMTTFVMTLN
jgi:hypothetical protein